tara:strand:- start:1161 stop:1559 length:399 start_codon:yes stop_codon:yes gene_type:complete
MASAKANPYDILNLAVKRLKDNGVLKPEGGQYQNYLFEKKENGRGYTVKLTRNGKAIEGKKVNFHVLLKNVEEDFPEKKKISLEEELLSDSISKLLRKAMSMEAELAAVKAERDALRAELDSLTGSSKHDSD